VAANSVVQARLISMKRFLLADVSTRLREQWPRSFIDVSLDDRGFVVAAFDFSQASAEGDVLGYMNTYVSSRCIFEAHRC
jgi:hypothetical protein